jgi:hypothetical protein
MSDDIKDIKPIEVDAELVDNDESNYPVVTDGNGNSNNNAVVRYDDDSISSYGVVARKSTICPICLRNDCMKINLARARDHKKITIIAAEFGTAPDSLRTHFRSHFIISENQQRIIDFKEDDSTEAKEIVSNIFEKNIDMVGGAQSVLQSKALRLTELNTLRQILADRREVDALDEVEKQEYVQYHKLINDLENSILQTYVTIDKKLFPFRKEDLGLAVTSYKLSVLQKLLDQVILVLIQFEKKGPEYAEMVKEMRVVLSEKFNEMEDIISKSGGLITPLGGDGGN